MVGAARFVTRLWCLCAVLVAQETRGALRQDLQHHIGSNRGYVTHNFSMPLSSVEDNFSDVHGSNHMIHNAEKSRHPTVCDVRRTNIEECRAVARKHGVVHHTHGLKRHSERCQIKIGRSSTIQSIGCRCPSDSSCWRVSWRALIVGGCLQRSCCGTNDERSVCHRRGLPRNPDRYRIMRNKTIPHASKETKELT